MKKAVIFPHGLGYAVTDEENYNARVRDANKICDIFPSFTPEAIAEVITKYGTYDEVIIVRGDE